MTHKYEVDQRVRHFDDRESTGRITKLTTLGEVVDGDCDDDEFDQPWYEVEWDVGGEGGCESEDSLEVIDDDCGGGNGPVIHILTYHGEDDKVVRAFRDGVMDDQIMDVIRQDMINNGECDDADIVIVEEEDDSRTIYRIEVDGDEWEWCYSLTETILEDLI